MTKADATDLLAGYRGASRSPVGVVAQSLATFEDVGAGLNVAITVLHDRARADAAESARRWRENCPRRLEGVPLGLKDIIAMAGVPMTGGSRLLADYVPQEDAAVVARLRDAGAVVVAKLTTFAFANGDPHNVDYGVTRNPADPGRLAGGSSSGSAAAVGAGVVPVTLGSDTGGSIRLPAAYCGVAGLKPTFGRVSRHGVLPLAWTLDHVGPIARSVRDLRLVLDVLSGADDRDPATAGVPSTPSRVPMDQLRVGVPDYYFTDGLDATTASAFEAALRTISTAGARIVDVHPPDLELMEPVGRTIITAEMASAHEPFVARLGDYDDLLGARLAAAPLIRATDYLKALRLRVVLHRGLASVYEHCDVMVTPTTPTVAPLIETLTVESGGVEVPWLDVAARNTFPFNISGMPTATVPAPGAALPVGVQIAGPMWADERVLDVAAWFEGLAAS